MELVPSIKMTASTVVSSDGFPGQQTSNTTASPSPHSDISTPDDVISNVTVSETGWVVTEGQWSEAGQPVGLYYVHLAYLCLAVGLGVPGNLLVVAAYSTVKHKCGSDWYMLYMGMLDLAVCLLWAPTQLVMLTGQWRRWGHGALCQCVYWLSHCLLCASVALFAFIAIHRYIKMCKPSVMVSANFCRTFLYWVSGGSMLLALPTVWMWTKGRQARCVLGPARLGVSVVTVYYALLLLLFIAMLVIVVVCYTAIVVKGNTSQHFINTHRHKCCCLIGDQGRRTSSNKMRNNRVGVKDGPGGELGSGNGGQCRIRAGDIGKEEMDRAGDTGKEEMDRAGDTGKEEMDRAGDTGKEETDTAVDGPTARTYTNNFLSAIATNLRDPMKKWSGDYCLLPKGKPADPQPVPNVRVGRLADTGRRTCVKATYPTNLGIANTSVCVVSVSPKLGTINNPYTLGPRLGPEGECSTSPFTRNKGQKDHLEEGFVTTVFKEDTDSIDSMEEDRGTDFTLLPKKDETWPNLQSQSWNKPENLNVFAEADNRVCERQLDTPGTHTCFPGVRSSLTIHLTATGEKGEPFVAPGSNADQHSNILYQLAADLGLSPGRARSVVCVNEPQADILTPSSTHVGLRETSGSSDWDEIKDVTDRTCRQEVKMRAGQQAPTSVYTMQWTGTSSVGQADTSLVGRADTSSVGQAGTRSVGQADTSSVQRADTSSGKQADTSSVGQADTGSVGRADTSSVGQADSSSVQRAGTSSVGQADTSSVQRADTSSGKQADTSSVGQADSGSVQRAGTRSMQQADTSSVQRADTSSVGQADTGSVGQPDTSSVQQADTSSGRADTGVTLSATQPPTLAGGWTGQGQSSGGTLRLTVLMAVVTVVYVVGWVPPLLAIVSFLGSTPPLSTTLRALRAYGPSCFVLKHFVSPAVYLSLSPAFRHSVRAVWRRGVNRVRPVGDIPHREGSVSQSGRLTRRHTLR